MAVYKEINTTGQIVASNIWFTGDLINGNGQIIIDAILISESGEKLRDINRSIIQINEIRDKYPETFSHIDSALREMCEIIFSAEIS